MIIALLFFGLCVNVSYVVSEAQPSVSSAAADTAFMTCQADLVSSLLANRPHMNLVRPAPAAGSATAYRPVLVNISLDLVGIVDINEKDGYMTTALFPKIQWTDPRLTWNESLCGGIKEIEIPAEDIWVPDIEVYNSFKESMADNAMHPIVTVLSNGMATYVPRRHVQTPCHFDLLNFPYDSQVCELVMGSWMYEMSKVALLPASTSKSQLLKFARASDWDVLGLDVTAASAHYGLDDTSLEYGTMYSKLTIKRRPSYFYRLYVTPAAVMIFAIPLVHFIPTGTSEKLTLCGSMLVTTVIMFNMLEKLFPAYSVGQVPVLLHYYSSVLLLLFLSMYTACTTAIIAHPGTKGSRLPILIKKFFVDKLGFMCCVTTRVNRFERELAHLEMHLKDAFSIYSSDDIGDRQMSHLEGRLDAGEQLTVPGASSAASDGGSGSSQHDAGSIGGALSRDQAVKVMQALVSEMQQVRYLDGCRLEWQQFATLLDRLAGLLFFVLAILVTVAIVDISL